MKLFRQLVVTIFVFAVSLLHAQDIPSPMSPPRLVNDFAGIFGSNEREELEQMLRAYNDSTSTQIYVVTVNDLQGYAVSDYAFRLGEQWQVGQKSKDNGAVILIKPKRGNSRGDVFIAVGYGLEATLNDARIGRIIDGYMIPHFREDDYYGGAKSAVLVMIDYLAGQFEADPSEDNSISASDILLGIVLIILFIYFMNKIGGGNNNSGTGSFGGGLSSRGSSRSSSRSFGGGFSRGSRGGSFGGGGGGSFGGGGAGRSW
ncbi:MAG: hypothetical protein RL662_942 [Bacteroidota bacterium]|jgi:uncharacterized protein